MPPHLTAVCFDHDGTLVDSERVHFQIWHDVLLSHGVDLPEEQYRLRYAGVPTPANAADLVDRHALAVAAPALAEEKRTATRAYLARRPFPLMPGAREALAHVAARGLGVAIVTGSNRSDVEATLHGHGLREAVGAVVSGDDVRRNKPAPDCYLLALRILGAKPEACVAVEDSEHGVLAAVSAGLSCVAVPNPMSRHQDFSRASAVVPDLAAAVRWIDAHFSTGLPNGPTTP